MSDQKCRICGCTDDDCSQCIRITGKPCHWVETDLCSACADAISKSNQQNDMNFFEQLAATGDVDLTMRIYKAKDLLHVEFSPGINVNSKPLTMSGTPQEFDAEFFSSIMSQVNEVKGLASNIAEVKKDLEEKAKNPKATEEEEEDGEEKVTKGSGAKERLPAKKSSAKKTPDNKKKGKAGNKTEKKKEEKPAVAEPNLFAAAAQEPAAEEPQNS